MENKNDLLLRAIEIAVKNHRTQFDKAGAPYVLHCFRVMLKGKTLDEQITGVLHDVIEDTGVDENTLREEGFSEIIIDAVMALTKMHGESNEEYLKKVTGNKIAARVMMYDVEDNMNLLRLKEIGVKDVKRLNKYIEMYRVLRAGME